MHLAYFHLRFTNKAAREMKKISDIVRAGEAKTYGWYFSLGFARILRLEADIGISI
jgi:hypothetical protein